MKKDEIITLLKKEIILHLKEYNKGETQAIRSKSAAIGGELIYILSLATNMDYNKVQNELLNEYEKEQQENENI